MNSIDCIILAGGLGTRLRPVVSDVPKVMAKVNGMPFLDLILKSIDRSGRTGRVVIAAGYMADQIIDFYRKRNNYVFKIDFSVEDKLLGTGGGIKKALPKTRSGQVLALNGDSFMNADIGRFIDFHNKKNALMSIVVKHMKNTGRYGFINFNESRKILAFNEKTENSGSGYINAGMYIFQRDLFDSIPFDKNISMEREIIPKYLKRGIYAFPGRGKFIDIGTPSSYKTASSYLREYKR